MRKIIIADRTVVLKSQSKDTSLSFKEKVEIARLLESAKVQVVEFPAIENVKIDTLLLKTICAFLKNSTMSVCTGMTEEGVTNAWNAISSASNPRLSVALPLSPVQMEYVCHKKAPKMLELITSLVTKAASLCKDVEFVALDATRAEKDFLYEAIKAAINAGAKTVTICDDEAAVLPDTFVSFINEIKENVPEINNVKLGVMCDNKNGCSAAASMMALAAGADEIKAACGNNMGIAPLLTVSNIVRNSGDRLGISADLNYTEFSRIISQVSNITDVKPATDVSSSAVPYSEFNLTENDDAQTVADAVKKLGYDLSEDDNTKVYEAFKDLAKKKPVSNKELDAIVATNALQVTPAYKLNNYVINSGNIIISSAQITLEKDEQEKNAIAIGDGPIDAAFNAIEQILGHHYELDDFQIQSVTEGREAVGSAIVRLRSNGKLYAGKGISTDIIGASIQAYINAINKIIFEEN